MPKLQRIIAFEGFDGSGKTTAVKKAECILSDNGLKALVINNLSPTISRVSRLLKHETRKLINDSELLIRLGRELQKVTLVNESPHNDFVLIDRYILSLKFWFVKYQRNDKLFNDLTQIFELRDLKFELVVCQCPFSICWQRINQRDHLSDAEKVGLEQCEQNYKIYYDTINSFNANPRLNLDTSKSIECSTLALETFLLPRR